MKILNMLLHTFSTPFLLKFYIAYVAILNLGRCQLFGRSFGDPRFRPQNITYPNWNSRRLNTSRHGINNNGETSSLRGHINFGADHYSRSRVLYNTFNDHSRRNQQPFVYLHRDNRIFRPRSPTFHNRGFENNAPSNNVANVQNGRIRVFPNGAVATPVHFRGNNARFPPYRTQTSSTVRTVLNQDRLRNLQRPTLLNSPARRSLQRQPHLSTSDNQVLGHSGMFPSRELSNQFQARRSIGVERPRIRAERNEVFQYRTSVMRAPRAGASGSRNNDNQQRFTGYPSRSLSLPFEPLSLRYQGFRESKLAAQQRLESERIRNANMQNSDAFQSGQLPSQAQLMLITDTANNNRNATFQPRITGRILTFSSENTRPFRSDNGIQHNIPPRNIVQGNRMTGDNTNAADRNRANSRFIRPFGARPPSSNNRHIGSNRNNLPRIRTQGGVPPARRFSNGFGISQPNDVWQNRRRNSIPQTPNRAVHEIFGISRTGLENALKSNALQFDQTNNSRNTKATKNYVSLQTNNDQRRTQTARNNRNKETLIADITKYLEIADKLDLLGLLRRHSQTSLRSKSREDINNDSDDILSRISDGFVDSTHTPRQRFREHDDDMDMHEDGFIND